MTSNQDRPPSPINTFAQIVAGLGALLSALALVWGVLAKSSPTLVVLFAVAVALLGAQVFVLARRAGHVSRLGNAEKLHIDPLRHLKGRAHYVRRLGETMRDNRLVFLDGESGAGKTALLQGGLVPFLANESECLPLYVCNYEWGNDWVSGPERSIALALRQAAGSMPPLAAHARTSEIVEALNTCHSSSGLTPCLIFDQFDDYQLLYRDRFVVPDGEVLASSTLASGNPFWAAIAALLRQDVVHCLFATRTENVTGLESVRFVAPRPFQLLRLSRGDALDLISSLTSDDGTILEPEAGWYELRDRLLDDLSENGVLPIQLKIALLGLQHLKRLTPNAYRDAGHLPGLEAIHVKQHIRAASTDPAALSDILVELVDRSKMPLKTRPLSEHDIETLRVRPPAEQRQLTDALRTLAMQDVEVVRLQGHDAVGSPLWRLDHDYLCPAVLHAAQTFNRWKQRLRDAEYAFAHSQHVWERWNSLLRLGDSARILIERLRGRLTYGTGRQVAVLSACRLVLNMWVVLALATGWLTHLLLTEQTSSQVVLAFDANSALHGSEVRALVTLQEGREPVVLETIDKFLESVASARALRAHEEFIVETVRRRGPSILSGVQRVLTRRCFARAPADPDIVSACVILAALLPRDSAISTHSLIERAFEVDDIPDLSDVLSLTRASDRRSLVQGALKRLAETETRMREAVDEEQRSQAEGRANKLIGWLAQLLNETSQSEFETELHDILPDAQAIDASAALHRGKALAKCTDRMTRAQLDTVAEQLVGAVDKATGPEDVYLYSSALAAFPKGAFARARIDHLCDTVCRRIETETSLAAALRLADALVALSDVIDPNQAERAARELLVQLPSGTPNDLPQAADAIRRLGIVDPAVVRGATEVLRKTLGNSVDATAITQAYSFWTLLGALAPADMRKLVQSKVKDAAAKTQDASLLALIDQEGDKPTREALQWSNAFASLEKGEVSGLSGRYEFTRLTSALYKGGRTDVVERLVKVSNDTQTAAVLMVTGAAVDGLGDRLDDESRRAMTRALLAGATQLAREQRQHSVLRSRDWSLEEPSPLALAELATHFLSDPSQATTAALANLLLDGALGRSSRTLISGLTRLSPTCSAPVSLMVWNRLLDFWRSLVERGSADAGQLPEALEAFGRRLDPAGARSCFGRLVKEIPRGTARECSVALGLINGDNVLDVGRTVGSWPTCGRSERIRFETETRRLRALLLLE